MGLRFRDDPTQLFQGRHAPPAHYILKTNSFSKISNYCSSQFNVGDYSWELNIYPNGNTMEGGEGHISLNIDITEISSYPIGWAVNAVIKFFVLDQIEDKYYTIPDYKLVHFSALKTGWGIPSFIDLQVFNDSSNGYLVNDSCVFGAEIFIIAPLNKVDVLSLPEDNGASFTRMHFWEIKSFTKPAPNSSSYKESDTFTCGDFKWRIRVYPDGYLEGKGNHVSIFLYLDLSTLPSHTKVTVAYKLRITNEDKSNVYEEKVNHCFTPAKPINGIPSFMSLAKLRDDKLGISVDDTLFVEAEIAIIGVITTQ